ncbi:MAG: endolytic transglycosylase MltG [Bacteroidales bacterium]|nr:endolytic transglycosylase MltG [Bacteroidales bacterium]
MMAISEKHLRGKSGKPLYHKLILGILVLAIFGAIIVAFLLFQAMMKPNVWAPDGQSASVFIPKGSGYDDVRQILYSQGLIINRRTFEWVAEKKGYPDMVKPGHYVIANGQNNNELVNMLRSGAQTPVSVIFNNIRTLEELAGRISIQIDEDSISLIECWRDRVFLSTLETTPEMVSVIFIPNTYEFWWTTDAYGFTQRMHSEFNKFWNDHRRQKASDAGLTIPEIVVLASIVEKESQKTDERPDIAGVYLNRLRKGWPLQADPTLVYAWGDFEITRVLNKHKVIDSPYNTYKHKGLPPGPICIPSISSIDAALDARKHDYMFFCARDDMSGYHVFARTLAEHNRHARAYQRSLNTRKIK